MPIITAQRHIKALVIITVITLLYLPKANSNENHSYVDEFIANMRWTADFSAKIQKGQNDRTATTHSIGYDIHSVISNGKKDIATIVLQNYLIRIDDLSPHSAIFSDEDDWTWFYRSFFVNYTNTCNNCPNIKFGHFIVPYGLEHEIDTAGELRDYNHGANLGLKMDWGFSLNKQNRTYEYELSYSLGSGANLDYQSGRHIISGRLSTPSYKNLIYALSLIDVNIEGKEKQKAAIDIKYYNGLFGYFFELGSGKHNSQSVIDHQFEINWRDSRENWLLFAQSYYSKISNHPSKRALTIGFRYQPDQRWTFEAKINQALHNNHNNKSANTLLAQMLYKY